jgi:peptidyl-prolyl cis-trans isomerase D
VELGEDHILVLRVSEHRKPAPQSLEDVRDVIRKQLEDEQARALAKSKGESLLTSLQSGTSLQEIASEQKLETGQSEGLVGRNASTPERSIVLKAFSLPVPAKDQAVPGGFVMKDGNYALVVLNEVQDGRLDALDASERMQARQELGQVQGASEMSAVMEALTDKAEIHIPEKEDQQ